MFSRVVRRTHMYAGLFLSPWMLMYGLSTVAMNHRASFQRWYGGSLTEWVQESEQSFGGRFSEGVPARAMAEQILRDLGLEGRFTANARKAEGTLVITRAGAIRPRRITYWPGSGRLVVERQAFRAEPFLEGLHRRRGYDSGYAADGLWAVSVDLSIAAIVFWAVSGVWVWWEVRAARRAGLVLGLIGLALFVVLAVTV
jgi:hypothetical protein